MSQNIMHWNFPGGPEAKTCTPNAEGPDSIPDQGTRSHTPQLKVCNVATKDPACRSQDPTQPNK